MRAASQLQIASPAPKGERQQLVSQNRLGLAEQRSPLYRKQPSRRKGTFEPSIVLIEKKNMMSLRHPTLRQPHNQPAKDLLHSHGGRHRQLPRQKAVGFAQYEQQHVGCALDTSLRTSGANAIYESKMLKPAKGIQLQSKLN